MTLRGANNGRFNLHNIIATTNAIRMMLEEELWTEMQISVITPYREQAARYRQVFRREKWFGIQVFAVDSVQGRQDSCTIFDIVLSYARIGAWGFVKDGLRLNVALSRSEDHFIFVCDMAALNPNEYHQQQLDDLDEEGRELRMIAERELGRYLRDVLNYFDRKRMMTYLVKADALPEASLLDMTPATEFRKRE